MPTGGPSRVAGPPVGTAAGVADGEAAVPVPQAPAYQALYASLAFRTATAQRAWTGAPQAGVASLIAAYFPPAELGNARAVALCESGMQSAVSAPNHDGSRDWGVFQLNDAGTLQHLLTRVGHPPADVGLALDPRWNVYMAALLWQQRGWQPWVCAAKLGIVAGLYSAQPGPSPRH